MKSKSFKATTKHVAEILHSEACSRPVLTLCPFHDESTFTARAEGLAPHYQRERENLI